MNFGEKSEFLAENLQLQRSFVVTMTMEKLGFSEMSCCCSGMSCIQREQPLKSNNKENFDTSGKIAFQLRCLFSLLVETEDQTLSDNIMTGMDRQPPPD